MDSLVINIVQHVFEEVPKRVEEIKGKGKNNSVFKIDLVSQSLILRLSSRQDALDLYKREEWCAKAAREKEIPTPLVLKVGTLNGTAFSFQGYVPGAHGTDRPELVGGIWFTLGQHARKFHQIDASDIKTDYRKMVTGIFENNYFISRGIFDQDLSTKIESRLEETFGWEFSPKLCHGNLHPSNVIVDESNTIHLIDWETATGNMVPQADLAEIYTWNTGKENVAKFLNGYGLSEEGVSGMMRDIQTLVLLRLVHVMVRKMPKDNNWQQDTYIKETAVRLTEIKDYTQDVLFTKNL